MRAVDAIDMAASVPGMLVAAANPAAAVATSRANRLCRYVPIYKKRGDTTPEQSTARLPANPSLPGLPGSHGRDIHYYRLGNLHFAIRNLQFSILKKIANRGNAGEGRSAPVMIVCKLP
jgi:hypothetical protein